MLSPFHLSHALPSRGRIVLHTVVTVLWMLLFAFGLVRFVLEREWGYAIVPAAFLVVLGLILLRLRAQYAAVTTPAPASDRPDPIE